MSTVGAKGVPSAHGTKWRHKMEYYIFIEDINKRELIRFNIFNSCSFYEGVMRAVKKAKRMKKEEGMKYLVKEIRGWGKYSFWSKCEYETVIHSLFEYTEEERREREEKGWPVYEMKPKKIDGWYQIEGNEEVIAEYVWCNTDRRGNELLD